MLNLFSYPLVGSFADSPLGWDLTMLYSITRSDMPMKKSFCLISLALAALLNLPLFAAAPARPNIVLFIADQHFADVMSSAGCDYVQTPALDSLAATGVRFRNTYCNYPVCMSSRASLMTGRWPHELGVVEGDDDDHSSSPTVSGKKPKSSGGKKSAQAGINTGKSLGTLMKEAGYETAYFGKWHVDHVSTSPENQWHGFDILEDGRRDEATADKAIAFINAKHDKPFFLVVSFLNPHDICEWARLRSGLTNKMGNGLIALEPPLTNCPPLPANFAIPADEPEVVGLRRLSQPTRAHPTQKWGETEWRQYRWAYARLIEKMDQQIGRVLTALKTAGLTDQTLVAYTSDHGDGDAAHHWNQKMVLYEEATRIPLIVSWPGHTPPGKVDGSRLVSMGLDLLPTFCDYAGVSVPAELTGRSLRPWAERSSTPPTNAPQFIVTEVNYSNLLPGEKLAQGLLVRTADYSYINYSAGKNHEQLFNLQTDPGQMTNLVARADQQTVLAKHRQLMRDWVKQTKSPFPLDKIP